ncbi:N6-adenosine-methyltransferase non-catalytic subunit-like [Sycon ciliatum]|uniref:N6-adenosine-methyltransferase non-catalytic subunit-like n=1 Tax=Sycon ciliatum TaxID=27933 RepID=UPI0031F68C28
MASPLEALKAKSRKRREILALQLGVDDADGLTKALASQEERAEARDVLPPQKIPRLAPDRAVVSSESDVGIRGNEVAKGPDGEQHAQATRVRRRSSEDVELSEKVYTDSSAFLKGTHSENPHNDYCQHFVDTRQRPQNFIRDPSIEERFAEYPKLHELMKLKKELLVQRATPPMYHKCNLEDFDFVSLDMLFDVILIDPPLEEYQHRMSGLRQRAWSIEEIMDLPIEHLGGIPSYCFLWCGASSMLDKGRDCLKKWGYRRCEDICWIKTNRTASNDPKNDHLEGASILQHAKEHCLMGIRGTVRRSVDHHFIHANMDLDLIIGEEPPLNSTEKPEEIYSIIENFCLGRRRLHLFASDTTLRPGWLSLGPDLTSSNLNLDLYRSFFEKNEDKVLGFHQEIDNLRPKTPPPKAQRDSQFRDKGGAGGGVVGGNMQMPPPPPVQPSTQPPPPLPPGPMGMPLPLGMAHHPGLMPPPPPGAAAALGHMANPVWRHPGPM